MIILGISYLSDAGACIVKNGKIISAINEERLNRIKLFYGIPEMSIRYVLKDAKITMHDVDVILTQGYCASEEGIEFIDHGLVGQEAKRQEAIMRVQEKIERSKLPFNDKKRQLQNIANRFEHENFAIYQRNINLIRQLKKFKRPIKVVEHHISHAAAAYFLSGWNEAYILTADGWGEMESNILCHAANGKIKKLGYSHSFDSLGYYYGSVTKALGFIPHRHEGKVLGLAAAGKARRSLAWMKEMIYYNKKRKCFEGGYENGIYNARFDNPALEKLIQGERREDVAHAVQMHLEKIVSDYVRDLVPAGSKLAVAGGIFANVRLNQRLLELANIKDLFVFPQMGDGGLAVGSALYYYSRKKTLKPASFKTLYLGPSYKDSAIEKEIKRFGFIYRRVADIEKKLAQILSHNKPVMRFCGKMEYGPRALGNRTILFPTTDKLVNDWLNKALRRSEFMPFAPATLAEKATLCYKNIKDHKGCGLFMTMTFDCTGWMKKKSPGVVHIDGTARPQLVSKAMNPSFYKVLRHYYALTGIPSLINTSFNMHEEPIVCSPTDALRAFRDSKLKYLAIEDFLVVTEKDDVLFTGDA